MELKDNHKTKNNRIKTHKNIFTLGNKTKGFRVINNTTYKWIGLGKITY